MRNSSAEYTVGHKKRDTLLLSISSPIIDQFSKFFHWHTPQTICNKVTRCSKYNQKIVDSTPRQVNSVSSHWLSAYE